METYTHRLRCTESFTESYTVSRRKERPGIRVRARTEKNQRQRLTEIHMAIALGTGRDTESLRGFTQRNDTKHRQRRGQFRGTQTEGQTQEDRDGRNIRDEKKINTETQSKTYTK